MNYTLLIPVTENQVLLGLKSKGFLEGKYNGFGGKFEPGETIYQAAVRELKEECDIEVIDMELMGIIYFDSPRQETTGVMYTFKVINWKGEPNEVENMKPEWFDVDDIPYWQMCPDDMYWFPYFLAGKQFEAKFTFDKDMKVLSHDVYEKDLSSVDIYSVPK